MELVQTVQSFLTCNLDVGIMRDWLRIGASAIGVRDDNTLQANQSGAGTAQCAGG